MVHTTQSPPRTAPERGGTGEFVSDGTHYTVTTTYCAGARRDGGVCVRWYTLHSHHHVLRRSEAGRRSLCQMVYTTQSPPRTAPERGGTGEFVSDGTHYTVTTTYCAGARRDGGVCVRWYTLHSHHHVLRRNEAGRGSLCQMVHTTQSPPRTAPERGGTAEFVSDGTHHTVTTTYCGGKIHGDFIEDSILGRNESYIGYRTPLS